MPNYLLFQLEDSKKGFYVIIMLEKHTLLEKETTYSVSRFKVIFLDLFCTQLVF